MTLIKLTNLRSIQLSPRLAKAVQSDPAKMHVLHIVSSYKAEELWIAGGFVRNLIWGQKSNDIDVYYYNKRITNLSSNFDEKIIEKVLRNKIKNVVWSVKNQARMHRKNGEEQYSDIIDAMAKQTDTASSVAMRYMKGNIYFIAPYGLDDLFNKRIRPTPHFDRPEKIERFFQRVLEKRWLEYNQIDMSDETKNTFEKYINEKYINQYKF